MSRYWNLKNRVRRLLSRNPQKYDLHYILSQVNPQASVQEKMSWLIHLFDWIRSDSELPHGFGDVSTGQIQSVRVRFIFRLLERNPELTARASQALRDILNGTNSIQLFSNTGITQQAGFFGELWDRLVSGLLPKPPNEADLSELFTRLFLDVNDATWVENLPDEIIIQIQEMLASSDSSQMAWVTIKEGAQDAVFYLSTQVVANGLTDEVRRRCPPVPLRELPFVQVRQSVEDFLDLHSKSAPLQEMKIAQAHCYRAISQSRQYVQHVFGHLEEFGVSVGLVYRLEKISAQLHRIEELLAFLTGEPTSPLLIKQFISELIRDTADRESLQSLFQTSLHQLSRKVVERAGHSGEHYITRTKAEYFDMIWSAGGGGIITTGTAAAKFVILWAKVPLFFEAGFTSIAYAGSFLLIQVFGFTLATKQPSMTAPALAGKLHDLESEKQLEEFTQEVANLTRSQFAAAVGNLATVIPCCFLFDGAFRLLFGKSFLDPESAHHMIDSLHPLKSLSIWYAILTGFLLFLSGLSAGWLENWAVYHRLPEAIAKNRKLKKIFGASFCQRVSSIFSHNISSFGGNVSLGILLGSVPIVGKFFGFPAEVRHLTLSTGSLALAAASQGPAQWGHPAFIAAIIGMVIIGFLNFTVSFGLALMVAVRARQIRAPGRSRIRRFLLKRLRERPLDFIFPTDAEERERRLHS